MRTIRNNQRERRGAAVVESAICLPLLALFFVMTIDYSRVYYASVAIAGAARNGALYASTDRSRANDTAGIVQAAKADTTNLDTTQVTVTSSVDNVVNPTTVTVTVTYPFKTITNLLGAMSS